MATKVCANEHCTATFEAKGARKFCELHANLGKLPTKKVSVNADLTQFLVPLMVTEAQLDDFWTKLPIEDKALAIQLYWDNFQA